MNRKTDDSQRICFLKNGLGDFGDANNSNRQRIQFFSPKFLGFNEISRKFAFPACVVFDTILRERVVLVGRIAMFECNLY